MHCQGPPVTHTQSTLNTALYENKLSLLPLDAQAPGRTRPAGPVRPAVLFGRNLPEQRQRDGREHGHADGGLPVSEPLCQYRHVHDVPLHAALLADTQREARLSVRFRLADAAQRLVRRRAEPPGADGVLLPDRLRPRGTGTEHHLRPGPLSAGHTDARHVPVRASHTPGSLAERPRAYPAHAGALRLHSLHCAAEQLRRRARGLRLCLALHLPAGHGHDAGRHARRTAHLLPRPHAQVPPSLAPPARGSVAVGGYGGAVLHARLRQDLRLVRHSLHAHRLGHDASVQGCTCGWPQAVLRCSVLASSVTATRGMPRASSSC